MHTTALTTLRKTVILVYTTTYSLFQTPPLPIPLHFFFNVTATTEIYTLSLHDALPIFGAHGHARERQLIDEERLEAARTGSDVLEVGVGQRPGRRTLKAGAGHYRAHGDEVVRTRDGQRPEHHGVGQAEHRGVGADANREGEHGKRREARVPPEHPQAVPQVLPHGQSSRRAASGSIREARRAGTSAATSVTPSSAGTTSA